MKETKPMMMFYVHETPMSDVQLLTPPALDHSGRTGREPCAHCVSIESVRLNPNAKEFVPQHAWGVENSPPLSFLPFNGYVRLVSKRPFTADGRRLCGAEDLRCWKPGIENRSRAELVPAGVACTANRPRETDAKAKTNSWSRKVVNGGKHNGSARVNGTAVLGGPAQPAPRPRVGTAEKVPVVSNPAEDAAPTHPNRVVNSGALTAVASPGVVNSVPTPSATSRQCAVAVLSGDSPAPCRDPPASPLTSAVSVTCGGLPSVRQQPEVSRLHQSGSRKGDLAVSPDVVTRRSRRAGRDSETRSSSSDASSGPPSPDECDAMTDAEPSCSGVRRPTGSTESSSPEHDDDDDDEDDDDEEDDEDGTEAAYLPSSSVESADDFICFSNDFYFDGDRRPCEPNDGRSIASAGESLPAFEPDVDQADLGGSADSGFSADPAEEDAAFDAESEFSEDDSVDDATGHLDDELWRMLSVSPMSLDYRPSAAAHRLGHDCCQLAPTRPCASCQRVAEANRKQRRLEATPSAGRRNPSRVRFRSGEQLATVHAAPDYDRAIGSDLLDLQRQRDRQRLWRQQVERTVAPAISPVLTAQHRARVLRERPELLADRDLECTAPAAAAAGRGPADGQ